MEKGYFQAAWNDIKQTPNWFGKICLMGLVLMIPVFGVIVVYGCLYGWAREIAWNLNRPMPAKLFGNEEGKLYRHGWFAFVIELVWSIAPMAIYLIAIAVDPSLVIDSNAGTTSPLALLLMALAAVLSLCATMLAEVGSLRMVIYDRLGAGLEFGQILKMARHDVSGLMRILGIQLIIGIIAGLVLGAFVLVYSLGLIALAVGSAGNLMVFAFMVAIPLLLFCCYLGMVLTAFAYVLAVRAIGYWMRNFRVAEWGASDDPLPFENDACAGSVA